MLAPWKESYDKSRQYFRKHTPHFADKGPCSQSYGFTSSCVKMWKLDHKEGWVLKNWCFWIVVLDKTHESCPLDCRDPISPSYRKSVLNIHWKDWYCSWSSNALATWCEEQTHWKRFWCRERLKAKREEGGKGWNSYIASLTQWTRIWANSGRCWRTSKLGMLQSMESQRIRHNLVTEQQ